MSAVSYLVVRASRLPPVLAILASVAVPVVAVRVVRAAKTDAPAAEETGPPIDVTADRDKLLFLTDGKQHMVFTSNGSLYTFVLN